MRGSLTCARSWGPDMAEVRRVTVVTRESLDNDVANVLTRTPTTTTRATLAAIIAASGGGGGSGAPFGAIISPVLWSGAEWVGVPPTTDRAPATLHLWVRTPGAPNPTAHARFAPGADVVMNVASLSGVLTVGGFGA